MYVAEPPDLDAILPSLVDSSRIVDALGAELPEGYPHWDKLRHLDPPNGLNPEEWWWAVKWNRRANARPLPLTFPDGTSFSYVLTDEVLRLLHLVDQRCSGEIAMAEVVTADDQARQHYLVNSLMEEAIRSSQLEGATTSRVSAKELLRTGRQPRDRSERMILNNYRALQFIRDDVGDTLSIEAILELQRILTTGTLDDPSTAGRFQTSADIRVGVYDGDALIHQPPAAELIPERMERLVAFANDRSGQPFMHPPVRAILLHLWLGYDHPFEDGNGRTARALFYWAMRARGYWLTEYLSVSAILRKAPAQYACSYLYTETDEGDATYFLLYQLSVIMRAIDNLHSYLRRKTKEIAEFEKLLKVSDGFNHRQTALLNDALGHPDRLYTFRSHAASHRVTHETSRRDLTKLADAGLLVRQRRGRRMVFTPPSDLANRLEQAT